MSNLLRGGTFDKRENPSKHFVDKARYAKGLRSAQLKWAKSVRRPMKSNAWKRINQVRNVRNSEIRVQGYIATQALYLPEFLDQDGNPYPLFRDAPIAVYSTLRLRSAAMDFYNFYDGTQYPNYDDPKFEDIMEYNTELSGERGSAFKDMQDIETTKGNLVRKQVNMKGFGGANALITMDADIGLDKSDPMISEPIGNTLIYCGFNTHAIYEVVRSLQNQYAIYYDSLEDVLRTRTFDDLDIPPFKPIYPKFQIEGVDYDALDYKLHINTLVKSTLMVFRFSLGENQTVQNYIDNEDSFNARRTQIVWGWNEAEAQEMEKIQNLATRLAGVVDGKTLNIDLSASLESPFAVERLARQRKERASPEITVWGDFDPNVSVSDRAMAISLNQSNQIEIKNLCGFFLELRRNQKLRTLILGDKPQKGLSQKERVGRTNITTAVLSKIAEIKEDLEGGLDQFFKNKNERIYSRRFKNYANVKSFTVDKNDFTKFDVEDDVLEPMSPLKNYTGDEDEIRERVQSEIDGLAKQAALTSVYDDLNDKQREIAWGFFLHFERVFGLEFFKWIEILGYNDRYFGFRLYARKPAKGIQDDLVTLCQKLNYVLKEQPRERELAERKQENQKAKADIYKELRTNLIDILLSFAGMKFFKDKIVNYITALYFKNQNYNTKTNRWKSIQILTKDYELPINVNYTPAAIKQATGAIFFATTKAQIENSLKYLDKYGQSAIGKCTYEQLVLFLQANPNASLLDLVAECTDTIPQLEKGRQIAVKNFLIESIKQYGNDDAFVFTLYHIVKIFQDVCGSLEVIPKNFLKEKGEIFPKITTPDIYRQGIEPLTPQELDELNKLTTQSQRVRAAFLEVKTDTPKKRKLKESLLKINEKLRLIQNRDGVASFFGSFRDFFQVNLRSMVDPLMLELTDEKGKNLVDLAHQKVQEGYGWLNQDKVKTVSWFINSFNVYEDFEDEELRFAKAKLIGRRRGGTTTYFDLFGSQLDSDFDDDNNEVYGGTWVFDQVDGRIQYNLSSEAKRNIKNFCMNASQYETNMMFDNWAGLSLVINVDNKSYINIDKEQPLQTLYNLLDGVQADSEIPNHQVQKMFKDDVQKSKDKKQTFNEYFYYKFYEDGKATQLEKLLYSLYINAIQEYLNTIRSNSLAVRKKARGAISSANINGIDKVLESINQAISEEPADFLPFPLLVNFKYN